ncbi:MAG: hypothetical protein RL398_208 [Planctomycetota bacterium]|jgi:hypothetical protein
MTNRETDVDRITALLGQCLGRIDEQAYRVQQLGDGGEDILAEQTFEDAAATLQELIGSLMMASTRPEPDSLVEPILRRSIQQVVGELGVPISAHEDIATNLPKAACTPGQLAFSVQRALMLAVSGIEPGGKLSVGARREADRVVIEVESNCPGGVAHLGDRATTLCEFVADYDGTCRVDSDGHGHILIALEVPAALAAR